MKDKNNKNSYRSKTFVLDTTGTSNHETGQNGDEPKKTLLVGDLLLGAMKHVWPVEKGLQLCLSHKHTV